MLVVGIGCGLRQRSWRQRRVAERLQANFRFSEGHKQSPVSRALWGDDRYDHLEEIYFYSSSTPITAKLLQELQLFPHLSYVLFTGCNFQNTALQNLAGVPKLSKLHCEDCQLTQHDITEITTLSQLQFLTVLGHPDGHIDLSALRKLTKLRGLVIDSATDQTMAEIAPLDLEFLYVHAAKVSDQGLFQLRSWRRLNQLLIHDAPLSGVGLTNLKMCTQLETFSLDGCSITSDGIEAICKIKSLKNIYLYRTNITPTDLIQLRRAIPNCEILPTSDFSR